MAIYNYKAKKGPQEVISGSIDADSEGEVISKICDMGLVPISVAEEGKPGVGIRESESGSQEPKETDNTIGRPESIRVRIRDVDTFAQQLAGLIRAKVPILRALSLISENTENPILSKVVQDLARLVRDGKMVSEAMARYPLIFNNLFLNMVRSGEKGGVLEQVLSKLSEHRQKEEETRSKVQAALAYPVFMIVAGIGAVFFMLTFFMPKLIVLFENMNQALPIPTRILIGTSNFMSHNWFWFLIFVVFFIAVFGRLRQGSKRKLFVDMLKLRLPFIKKFVKDAEIAKFARTLGILLKAGIPVYESLQLATDTLDNDALKVRLQQARKDIIYQGSTLSSGLKKADIFSDFVVNMIRVGEEGGKLDDALTEVASSYERQVEQAIKIFTTLLEPLLILVVGSIVGFIVFAMLLPIFNIGAAVK